MHTTENGRNPLSFRLKEDSLLLTVGKVYDGDIAQDFMIVARNNKKPNLIKLGIALGINAIRHPELIEILKKAVEVIKDKDNWIYEDKEFKEIQF